MAKITYEGEATLRPRARGNIKPHGRGKMIYVDGDYAGYRYEGEFSEGYSHGQGKWYRPCGTLEYEGGWKKDAYHGRGRLVYLDGDYAGYRYEGEFFEGSEHGEGKWYRPDGTLEYCGGWSKGFNHGRGRSYHPDGTTIEYDGEWKEGEWHGQGTLHNPDGTIKRTGMWSWSEPDETAAPA